MNDCEPDYYLEIYPIHVKNNKLRSVYLIGNFFRLDKYRHVKLNKNTFKHKDMGISIDSIIDYQNLKYELSSIMSFYGDSIDLEISDTDLERFNKMKQRLEKIQNDWARKADAFLAWKRRRQIIAAWQREYDAS